MFDPLSNFKLNKILSAVNALPTTLASSFTDVKNAINGVSTKVDVVTKNTEKNGFSEIGKLCYRRIVTAADASGSEILSIAGKGEILGFLMQDLYLNGSKQTTSGMTLTVDGKDYKFNADSNGSAHYDFQYLACNRAIKSGEYYSLPALTKAASNEYGFTNKMIITMPTSDTLGNGVFVNIFNSVSYSLYTSPYTVLEYPEGVLPLTLAKTTYFYSQEPIGFDSSLSIVLRTITGVPSSSTLEIIYSLVS